MDRSDEERYFGCVMLANGLVNLEILGKQAGRTTDLSSVPPARPGSGEGGGDV